MKIFCVSIIIGVMSVGNVTWAGEANKVPQLSERLSEVSQEEVKPMPRSYEKPLLMQNSFQDLSSDTRDNVKYPKALKGFPQSLINSGK